jgi:sugar lactone lactonase YvrE
MKKSLLIALVVVAVGIGFIRLLYGGGARLEDRTTVPEISTRFVETVANLPYPPGNIAVSADGRVFFTYHPDAAPPVNVLELVNGEPVPYPSKDFADWQTVLSVRIDRQNRLWTLDHAGYGRGTPRLIAFDLATNTEVYRHEFDDEVAGMLSMLNDFQIDPAGETIYIADASPIVHQPAILVHDVKTRTTRRVLDEHPSVQTEDYRIQAPGRDMVVLGIFTLRIGVDSIALDRQGEWLYYGPVTGATLYRVRTADLRDASLSPEALGARVEPYAPKTISDGMSSDDQGNLYLTDPEHSAVLRVGTDRRLHTLVKDPMFRWPDGLSFGPDGWLYVTCSALEVVLFTAGGAVADNAPYQIYRFKPGGTAPAGQ